MKIIYKIEEALEVILNQKILIIFQKDSELGPRALGNRSTLFDPRNKNATNITENKFQFVKVEKSITCILRLTNEKLYIF